jgi:bifunctional non-homologous end joining protein LigD
MTRRPDLVTLEQRASRRTGKVFFDYTMNARVKTLIAPYSPRGLYGAPVAMPIEWNELPAVDPFDFTIETAPGILAKRGDRWADILRATQDIAAILSQS